MNKIIFSLLCLIAFGSFSTSIQGESIEVETGNISVVRDYADKDSLVLFNITGTLYEPASMLADNKWRLYFAERVKNLISDQECAQRYIDKVKNLIVNNIPKKAVEKATPDLIADLQSQKIPVLGITQKSPSTSYADDFGLITKNHLLSIGIDLEKTLSYYNVLEGERSDNCTFLHGIIFSNKRPVGPAVLSFFKRIKMVPAKIIMLDDSYSSLENVGHALESSGIDFISIYYPLSKLQSLPFDPILGIIEFFAFVNEGKVLSDYEARQIKANHPEANFEADLDQFIMDNATQ